MADNTPALSSIPAAMAPLQAPRAGDTATAAADANAFRVSAAPWSFLPTNTTLFSSLAEGAFGAPTPTADYEKKVIEWLPPTPAGDAAAPTHGAWETPAPAAGLPRPQPQKPDPTVLAPVPVSMLAPSRSESPIDVVNTSAFASVDQSPAKDDGALEIARPQPLRVNSMDASVNPLLILASESQQHQQQQPLVTLASAFGIQPTDSVLMSTEPGNSSGSEQNNVSPPSRGCYTRAPGLGPPPETPTSANGQTGAPYVCSVCGFASTSKFHYNSHMNTHGDHQCTMCDYTSRTEGRLKKHMRESHTTEEQRAAGLELTPPTAAAPASASASFTNNSPSKDDEMDSSPEGPLSGIDCSPGTLSSTLLGMIATSTSSSMTSALEQMRAITEQPLLGDGSTDGMLLVGTPLGLGMPMKEEGASGGGGGGRRKMKIYKCKQCPHISQTKEEQWAHARSHIPSDKQMSCDKCNFVTEYKHHLEYHQRNHAGIKPFQCKKCNYTCVNKSMLNSHMKSHSNVYQFRCADCNYATKYCHSLKLHLKKYGHRRNTEGLTEADLLASLSAESSPPTMRKDSTASIASSLSGPFTPFNLIKREEPSTPLGTPQMPNFSMPPMATSQSLNYATQLLMRQHQFEQMMHHQPPTHRCFMCEFSCGSQEDLVRHNLTHLFNNSSLYQALGVQASLGIPIQDRSADDDHHTTTGSPSGDDAVSHSNGSAGSPLGSGRGSSDEGEGGASRRKSSKPSRIAIDDIGLALLDKASPDTTVQQKMEIKQEEAMDTSSDENASATVDITASSEQLVLPPLPAPQPLQPMQQLPPGNLLAAIQQHSTEGALPHMASMRQALFAHLAGMPRSHGERFRHECTHCNMGFVDQNMHAVHMSYHSRENPMQCSRCGLVCASALHFYLHLLQSQHM